MSEIFARNNFKMWYVYSPQTGHRLLFLAAEVICLVKRVKNFNA